MVQLLTFVQKLNTSQTRLSLLAKACFSDYSRMLIQISKEQVIVYMLYEQISNIVYLWYVCTTLGYDKEE